MPLMLPKQRAITRESNLSGRPAGPWGTTVTSDGVAHTLPTAYTELIAATTYDSDWVNIAFTNNNASNTDTDSLVTVYIGAGTAEQVLIPTLLAGWTANSAASFHFKRYSFPLHVPAGSRISARHQSVRTSTSVNMWIELLGGCSGDHWTGTRVECVGADTGTSGGTAVTAGGASEGTLTSIGTNTYEWGYVQPMIGGNTTDTSMNNGLVGCDLASSSSTANLISGLDDFLFDTTASETAAPVGSSGRFCTIPASTTLYLRSQTSATAEGQDWCIYGVF